jgi:DNA-binding MarR family transcriptional regulator
MSASAVSAQADSVLYYSTNGYTAQTSIGYLVRRASHLISARVESRFAAFDVTFMQWVVLLHIRDKIAMTAAEIGRLVGHDSGAMTRLVDHLAQRGLVERRRSSRDRRIVTLSLTDQGSSTVEALMPAVVDCLNQAVAAFTREEADTLTRLLTKFVDGISAVEAKSSASELDGVKV